MAIAAERGFARKTIGDLVAARSILHLDCLDEESVEELLMHVMLEIIIAARSGIDSTASSGGGEAPIAVAAMNGKLVAEARCTPTARRG